MMRDSTKICRSEMFNCLSAFIATVVLAVLVPLPAFAANEEAFPRTSEGQEQFIQMYVDRAYGMNAAPDYEALEDFYRDLKEKVANHQAYERAPGTFVEAIAMSSLGQEGAANLARWREKRPTSPTPALASILGRLKMVSSDLGLSLGSNWVWHPVPDAAHEFEGVRTELLNIRRFASEDPQWHVLMAITTIALKRDLKELHNLVDDGLARHPANFELVQVAAAGHLSKWQGNAEGLERWAQHVLTLSPPTDGMANYARIYKVAMRAQYGALLFDLAKPNWKTLMGAIRDLISRHPNDEHLNDAAVLACIGGNRALTREALVHANYQYADVYWYDIGTEYHPYEICRSWAGDTDRKNAVPTANP